MSKKIRDDELYVEIKACLEEWKGLTHDAMKKAVETVTAEATKIIKENAPVDKKSKRKGKYKRSIKSDVVYEDSHTLRTKIHAGKSEWGLSHLLEDGHKLVGHHGTMKGKVIGHAKAFPHFSKGEKYAQENLEKEIKKEIERK